jgi:hypothetical protein
MQQSQTTYSYENLQKLSQLTEIIENKLSENKWQTIKKKQRKSKHKIENINTLKEQEQNINTLKEQEINITPTKIVNSTNVCKIEEGLQISKYIPDTQSYLYQMSNDITYQLNKMSFYSFSKNNPNLIPNETVIPCNICGKILIETAIKNNPKLDSNTIRSPYFSSIFFSPEYIKKYECVIYVELKNKTIKNNTLVIWYNGNSTPEHRLVDIGYNYISYATFGELKRALEIGIYQKEHQQNQY